MSARDGVRRILVLTGTRADYGKLKTLMGLLEADARFELLVFATGMHLKRQFGYTFNEIVLGGYRNVFPYVNQATGTPMDLTLATTIEGLSLYVHENAPDLIVVHGDRVEALSGAIVGALNNIPVAHIEGGELSGTIDESIRHAVSKLSHLHFVANEDARQRLFRMGESPERVFVIGSPDIDVMLHGVLPTWAQVKDRYAIPFDDYAIAAFHPVTTAGADMEVYAHTFAQALQASGRNFIVIHPNNDHGSHFVLDAYQALAGLPRFVLVPSMRFEYFLAAMRGARFVIGNSSAGVREAGVYGVPAVDVGDRQANRYRPHRGILSTGYGYGEIAAAIRRAGQITDLEPRFDFGSGGSAERFLAVIGDEATWRLPVQKVFVDPSTPLLMGG